MLTVLSFLKRHWRPIACVAALVLAYGAGRFAGPTKVHVVTVVDTQVVTVAGKERVVYKNRSTQVDKTTVKVTAPDGTVTETITDKTKRVAASSEAAKETSSTAASSSAKTEKLTVSDAPRLTVGVLVGYQHQPSVQLIPNAGPLSVGAFVNYRIAGPVTVGVQATTTGAVHGVVAAQF